MVFEYKEVYMNYKLKIFLSLILFPVFLSSCNGNSDTKSKVADHLVNNGTAIYKSGNESRKSIYIIKSQEEYDSALDEFSYIVFESPNELEEIFQGGAFDFQNSQVVIIALGLINSMESVDIESVLEYENRIVVSAILNRLGNNSIATQAGHHPAVRVIVNSKKPIVIEEKINTL